MLRNFLRRGIRWSGLIMGPLLLITPLAFAQTPRNINWSRMQRDLDIMESVLNKLLEPSSREWGLWKGKARGIYFEGYGVVFQVDYSGNYMFLLSTKKLEESLQQSQKKLLELNSHQRGDEVLVMKAKSESEEKAPETSMTKRIEDLKERLTEFLGSYADAIGQLNDTERITVLVSLGNDKSFYVFPEQLLRVGRNRISMLEATVKKSNIIAYRRGRINENEFRKHVVFHERTQDDDIKMNIEIMAEIMDKALSKKYHKEFGAEGKSHGIYLEGLGVLFFMKGVLNREGLASPIQIYLDEYIKGQEIKITRKEREKRSKKKIHKYLDEFKNALVEVVGDYGHTLRTLKPTEYVVIAVDFKDIWSYSEYGPTRFIMKVQKKDLDTYNRGNLKLDEFSKQVEFLEY
ncbi:MAG: hypothetical protein ACE5JB_11630 [bacterium]